MPSGTNPVRLLFAMLSSSTFSILNDFDRIPLNEFELMSNTVTFEIWKISGGTHPPSLLFEKINSFKFLIFPMLLGMQPSKLLLAMTRTETLELPIVSGMLHLNLLLFRNSASKSLLKSSAGRHPSKSLNLMSRYLRPGIIRTTSGNPPTKRLLLISNSYRSVSLPKLWGTIPQNLFEFMWNTAMSLNRPNSTGRYPAMSAPLRSMPATTSSSGSSRALSQNTPVYLHTSGPTQFSVVFRGSEYMLFFQAWSAMYARRSLALGNFRFSSTSCS